jgi:hypothetical protein
MMISLMNGLKSQAQFIPVGSAAPGALTPNKVDKLYVWLLALSTFFPYLSIPIGQSTSIPITSVLSVAVLPRLLHSLPMMRFVLVLTFGPWVASFLAVLFGVAQANVAALVTWSLLSSAIFGFLYVGERFPILLYRPLQVGVLFSSIFALVQKYFFLDAGVIPFLGYYSSPDYANIQVRAEVITQYIRRPFAFFPEPSFMAGSLAIAVVAMILVRRTGYRTALTTLDWISLAVVSAAIVVSASGSALVSLGIIWVVAVWPRLRGFGRLTFLVFAGAGIYIVSITVLATRNVSQNWSWDDRGASILGGLRLLFSDPLLMMIGVGKGRSPILFSNGDVPMGGLDYFTYLPDMYSAAGRILFENGLIVGGIMLAVLFASTSAGVAKYLGILPGLVSAVLWLVIAGLTISYESAVWLWALPALAFGVRLHSNMITSKPGVNNGRIST